MVDASIVLVENASRKLSELGPKPDPALRREALVEASKEVGPGIFFSLLIITVSFLPVFALTDKASGCSARWPIQAYAMAFAAILSVTLVPVLMLYLMRGRFR